MDRTPAVSVIMAAYNAAPFVGAAVSSVLAQDFRDFELVVVDDGSTDGTSEAIEAARVPGVAMRLIRQENRGLANARNTALRHARGPLIAVADADDVQLPDRLGLLHAEFARDGRLDVCGGWVEHWDGSSSPGCVHRQPAGDAAIRAGFVFESLLFDPTVMYRRGALESSGDVYSESFRMAVDYDLWSRLWPRARFANVQRVLTRYRRHPAQITLTQHKSGRSLEERRRVWSRFCAAITGETPSSDDLAAHEVASSWMLEVTAGQRRAAGAWLERLLRENRRTGAVPAAAFGETLKARWRWVCSRPPGAGPRSFAAFLGSPLSRCGTADPRGFASLARRSLVPI